MGWAQRLRRVFKIGIETCPDRGGTLRIIASIEEPAVIRQILDHLQTKVESQALRPWPQTRVPRSAPSDAQPNRAEVERLEERFQVPLR